MLEVSLIYQGPPDRNNNMKSLTLNSGSASSSVLRSLKPPSPTDFLSSSSPSALSNLRLLRLPCHLKERTRRIGIICRSELSQDAPFVVAIGACMLSSLLLPVGAASDDDNDSAAPLDSTDTRFAAMGIISFIPYFNWLSWVFAWLDTGKRRYALYTLVYLAPYLRSNLSLSPEESWLPIASILFCIVHIQLEASIRNGDIQGFQLFSKATEYSPMTRKKHIDSKNDSKNLPAAQDDNEIGWWEDPQKPSEDSELLEDDREDGGTRRSKH